MSFEFEGVPVMRVRELLFSDLPKSVDGDSEVTGIAIDSRLVRPGFIFIAIPGNSGNGHEHVSAAIQAGAILLIVQDGGRVPREFQDRALVVSDARFEASKLANLFSGEPSQKMFVVGVTGTNGKTTTTHLIEHVFTSLGWPTGVLGTIDHHLKDRVWPTALTTPDAITLHRRLAEMQSLGAKGIAMEVSSHALDQRRADHVSFAARVFTNLSQDHLDYHKDMQNYFEAKARLFTKSFVNHKLSHTTNVIYRDDPWGKTLLQRLHQAGVPSVMSYGRNDSVLQSQDLKSQDLSYEVLQQNLDGMRFKLTCAFEGLTQKIEVILPLLGHFNAANACAALAVGFAAGFEIERMASLLSKFPGVPGRLQRLFDIPDRKVFVDYAHTEDALENTLGVVRSSKGDGRLICVMGCGGDRDATKRPKMGAVAASYSDLVILTSDNPRSEDPEEILDQIELGIKNRKSFERWTDRRQAIYRALDISRAGDVIVIAGKGHETYQIIGDQRHHFDDREVAREWMVKT